MMDLSRAAAEKRRIILPIAIAAPIGVLLRERVG